MAIKASTCPHCGRMLYNRKSPTCGYCQGAVPDALLLTPQQRATLEHTTEALRKSHDAFLQQHHTRMTRLLASLDEDSDVHALLARCGKDDVAARGAQTPDEAIHAYLCSAEFMVVGGLGMLAAIPGER